MQGLQVGTANPPDMSTPSMTACANRPPPLFPGTRGRKLQCRRPPETPDSSGHVSLGAALRTSVLYSMPVSLGVTAVCHGNTTLQGNGLPGGCARFKRQRLC